VTPALEVLYEDNHLLAVNKPAGLATMGTPGDRPTLLALAKEYVKRKYHKPGNVYLGVMSRLDAPVTGVVLLARTSKAARRLTEQFRAHAAKKIYRALVEGAIEPAVGRYVDWLAEDERHRRMHVVGPEHASRAAPADADTFGSMAAPGAAACPSSAGHTAGRGARPAAKEARLAYRRLATVGGSSLLEVEPQTGRKHQIRLQLAYHGHPVVGDRKYGSRLRFPLGIALHSWRLSVAHPVGGQRLDLEAPLPKTWPDACRFF
jgi:23S rRNA pseudouridine1911/1915/1917 synthase